MREFRKSIELASRSTGLSSGTGDREPGGSDVRPTAGMTPAPWTNYLISLAANTNTRIPAAMRYTAKGTNPCLRTQAMNHATEA